MEITGIWEINSLPLHLHSPELSKEWVFVCQKGERKISVPKNLDRTWPEEYGWRATTTYRNNLGAFFSLFPLSLYQQWIGGVGKHHVQMGMLTNTQYQILKCPARKWVTCIPIWDHFYFHDGFSTSESGPVNWVKANPTAGGGGSREYLSSSIAEAK